MLTIVPRMRPLQVTRADLLLATYDDLDAALV